MKMIGYLSGVGVAIVLIAGIDCSAAEKVERKKAVVTIESRSDSHLTGKGKFVDRSRSAGVWSQGKGHGVTFVDWSGDGFLEIYAEKGGFYHGDLYHGSFFLNETPKGNHYLFIDLSEDGPNRLAVGAGVTVQAGELKIYKEVTSGRGFGSSDPPTLHFGLGKNPRIDHLRVRWPDGSSAEYPSPPVDKRIVIHKGEKSWTVKSPPP